MGNPHFWPILTWTVVLAVVVAVGGIVLVVVRRRLFQSDAPGHGVQLSLQDLREMLGRGEIQAEEFEALKASLLGGAASSRKPGGPTVAGPSSKRQPGRDFRAAPGFDLTGDALPEGERDAPEDGGEGTRSSGT